MKLSLFGAFKKEEGQPGSNALQGSVRAWACCKPCRSPQSRSGGSFCRNATLYWNAFYSKYFLKTKDLNFKTRREPGSAGRRHPVSSESLFLSNILLLAGFRSGVVGLLVVDGAPDEQVSDEEVDKGQDAGGDEPGPVEVVEDVGRVLPQLCDVVVHYLRPDQ